MLLALVFGGSILTLLDHIPTAVLGVMVVIAGHALAMNGCTFLVSNPDLSKLRTSTGVSILTAVVILALKKTHYGAIVGFVAHMLYGEGVSECRQWCCYRWGRNSNDTQRGSTVAVAYTQIPVESNETRLDDGDSKESIQVV